ncbi:TonB-dependent receptor [Aquiflexum sp. TKW24L]|uniref:TonB-dependent receptor n=1 Tax=Aquiflexum sp. TKW24L TaxID=2942212 RepID=UPI0020BFC105|nr:TonB-dependent receptor [Aquiflexum sp. TKW24L]MCL6258810.1 TonB-dependent receptor [Aquiflexum sp. TKW24L]
MKENQMKRSVQKAFLFTILSLITWAVLPGLALGQQKGEVKDQEFIIRKDRVLTLPVQPRRFDRAPALPSAKGSSSFQYDVKQYFLTLPPIGIKAEAAQKNFPRLVEELYPGFVRAGYGNYGSPLLEGRYNIWENNNYNLGAKFRHQSFSKGPVGEEASSESFSNFGLDGTYFMDVFQVYGGLKYDRHKFNFYGFDPENLNLVDYLPSQNIFNTFQLFGGIQDIDKMEGLNYNARLGIRAFNDNFLASENEVAITANSSYWYNDNLNGTIDFDISLTSPKDEFYGDINRNYFKTKPNISYRDEALKISVGVNIVFENDVTLNKKSDFHVLPALAGEYMLSKEFGIYGAFEGDVLRKTYYDFVMENQFLGPSSQLLNTIQNFKTGAGIKGTVLDGLTYEAGFNVGKYRNMHFFANSASDSLTFNLLFDENTRVLNYRAKVGWEYEEWYKMSLTADYFHYTLSSLGAAYHRPEWEFTLNNQFTPAEKWLVYVNAHLMGGIVGFNQQSDLLVVLPAILDLQLKADYQITERISAFVIGNNLLNRNNQRFLNYPVRGIQGIVGATIKF